MSIQPRILVTTGTSRTGSAAATELLRQGCRVRVLVRKDDHRIEHLRRAGAEVAVGNLHQWRDLRKALRGVQRACHCPPVDSRQLHRSMLFALAAEEAGLEAVRIDERMESAPQSPVRHAARALAGEQPVPPHAVGRGHPHQPRDLRLRLLAEPPHGQALRRPAAAVRRRPHCAAVERGHRRRRRGRVGGPRPVCRTLPAPDGP